MEKKINKKSGSIDVTVIQAHEEILPGGGFVRRRPGDDIRIAAADFCANLHRRSEIRGLMSEVRRQRRIDDC